MAEIWRDIPWYEWLYQISTFWNVKSIWRNKILKWYAPPNRYTMFMLSKNWIITMRTWHRLVAESFLWLDISDKNQYVCHKDDNTRNNYIDNLFIWTPKQNMSDKIEKWREKYRNTSIMQYTLSWEFIKTWESIISIERELWIFKWNIWKCCNWKRKKAWWFLWKYY